MPTNMYIGLYKTHPHRPLAGYWHWKIIVARGPLNVLVDSYSVAEDAAGNWQKTHRLSQYNEGVKLLKSGAFFALIRLPPVNASEHDIRQFLVNQSAQQDNTPVIRERGEWSCAQWVIRVLQEINSRGLFSAAPAGNLSDRSAYYHYIRLKKGAVCEAGIDAGSTNPDIIGVTQDGIRVMY